MSIPKSEILDGVLITQHSERDKQSFLLAGDIMSVIYFNSNNEEKPDRLRYIFETDGLAGRVELCRSIKALSNRLSRVQLGQGIAVLLISTEAEFHMIYSIRNLLNDTRLILILPDRSSEIISAAYKLHPRFISFMDNDLREVSSILKKMIKLLEQRMSTTEFAVRDFYPT